MINEQNIQSKLNRLLTSWPKGAVLTLPQLRLKGFSKQLIDQYKTSKWIASIGKGAYKLYHDEVDWYGALFALQSAGMPIHTGAKTSLELLGYAHYLAARMPRCFLFGASGTRLPKWFVNYNWGLTIFYQTTGLFPAALESGFMDYEYKEFSISISTPERAAFEMMYHVPVKQGFDEAFRIMENLTTLRPEVVQMLLLKCRSVKVKRLFMYMAEKAAHSWVNELNLAEVNFGSGKRVIVVKGMLDKKYQITVQQDNA